ncbi:MAG: carboxypeptidase regulatory-like domain-containing protein [Gemmatimonadetes bacterium]|nr:carboxypeptidase regulatory-like domain-containing protein [Gemmatimonadota bacterium]
MFRRIFPAAGLLLLAAAGCRDLIAPNERISPPDGTTLELEEAFPQDSLVRELARPTFFLPPMAAPARLPGELDENVDAVVEVCAWSGAACMEAPLARFSRREGSPRVSVTGGAYHVNWDLSDYPVLVGQVYRVRVLVNGLETAHQDVKVVRDAAAASGAMAQGYTGAVVNRTLPVRFYVQKVRRLIVGYMDEGVRGTPAEQDTLYAYGTEVPWSFTPAAGYDSVEVWLDGERVELAGVLRMDRDHALLVSASRQLVLNPEDQPLVESARAILAASDKPAAFQVHLDQVAALFGRVEPQEAAERMLAVERAAYDPERDREALRQAHLALNNHHFRITGAPDLAARAAGPASAPRLSASVAAAQAFTPRTTFYSINGILNTPSGAASYYASVQLTLVETSVTQYDAKYVYNSSWLFSDKVTATHCFSNLFAGAWYEAAIKFPFRLTRCFALIGYNFLAVIGDLSEAGYQVARLYSELPIPAIPDSYKLADSIQSGLGRSDQVILLPHSQGNLLTQEAMQYLGQTDPRLRAGATACVGVVSLATPNNNHWGPIAQLDGIIQRRDIILHLPTPQFTPVNTQLSRENADKARRAYRTAAWASILTLGLGTIPAIAIAAGYDLALQGAMHSSTESYLNPKGARGLVKNAIVRQVGAIPGTPGCPAAATVQVSPATLDMQVGEGSQLQATVLDAQGRVLSGRNVSWTSSNTAVARVQNALMLVPARVTAVAPGSATLTARTADGATGTTIVRVAGATGQLTGRVVDGATRAGLAGATVTFTGPAGTALATTASDGSYLSPQLAEGTYQVQASRAGYVPANLYGAQVAADQRRTIETIPLAPESAYPGGISGTVRDARNGRGIAGVRVEIREGMNATEGAPLATTLTDANGVYRASGLPAGTYSVRGQASGYAEGILTGIVIGTREVGQQDVTLSPNTDDITIVLRWGATPRDLDSHLTGPTAAGSRFHVFYAAPGTLGASPWAALDIDDVSSYGPETITISRQLSGTYRYSVHDYTNRFSTTSNQLATSGALLRVYRGGQLLGEFNVPNQPGTVWTVFELDGGTLRPVNAMSFESSPDLVGLRASNSGTGSGSGASDATLIGQAVQQHAKP